MSEIVRHDAPALESEGDTRIRANLTRDGYVGSTEELWAQKIGDRKFRICCVPFFTYGIVLGDIVETDEDYVFQKIQEFSGNSNIRLTIADKAQAKQLHRLLQTWAEESYMLYEWYDESHLVMNIWSDVSEAGLLLELSDQLDAGEIVFELDD